MSTLDLKLSDLVSGGLCVAYDYFMPSNVSKTTRFVEQVAHRVVGRAINVKTDLPQVNLIVAENDLYAGAVAVADNSIRKDKGLKSSAFEGLRASISSWGADKVHQVANIPDRTLLAI